MITILLILSMMVYLFILMRNLRYHYLVRMAVRNLLVNKKSTFMAALGVMIGIALVTSTLIVISSVAKSNDDFFEKHFGVIVSDFPAERQTNLSREYFTEQDITKMTDVIHGVDASATVLPVAALDTVLAYNDRDEKEVKYSPKVYVIGMNPSEAKAFDPSATFGADLDLHKGKIVLTEEVARELGVSIGEKVFIADRYKEQHVFAVSGIISPSGVLGYKGIGESRGTAIVSLEDGETLAKTKKGEFTNVLSSIEQPVGQGWEQIFVKQKATDVLTVTVDGLLMFSLTTVNALLLGVVLVFSVLRLIFDERRDQTVMLLKIGMKRKDVARLFRLEGMLFGVISSFMGTIVGIALSYFTFLDVTNIFSSALPYPGLSFSFHLNPIVIAGGFFIGLIIVHGCAWIISLTHARMNIAGQEPFGPALSQLKRPSSSDRIAKIISVSILVCTLIFTTATVRYINDVSLLSIFTSLLILAVLAVLITVQFFDSIKTCIQFFIRPFSRMTVLTRLVFGYLKKGRMRTGLLLLMFTLVFYLLTFVIMIFTEGEVDRTKGLDNRKALGGYDYIAIADGIVDGDELQNIIEQADESIVGEVEEAVRVPQLHLTTVDYGTYSRDFYVNGIDETFIENTELTFVVRDVRYEDEQSVWKGLLNDPNTVVISQAIREVTSYGISGIGDTIQFDINGKFVEKRIIGVVMPEDEHYEHAVSNGIWLSEEALMDLTDDKRLFRTSLLIRTVPGHDEGFMTRMQDHLKKYNIFPLINPYDNWPDIMQQFFSLFEWFSSITIVMSIIGLTVVMTRVLNERKREISLLKVIGLSDGMVFWMVWLEGTLIGWIGITLGVITGIYSGAFMLYMSPESLSGNAVTLPVVHLVIFYTAGLLSTVLFAALPARKARKIKRTEMTRIVG